jgi:hypothetical protein
MKGARSDYLLFVQVNTQEEILDVDLGVVLDEA